MLWTSTAILMMLWFLGVVSHDTMGGLIHILLMVSLITASGRFMQSRRLA